MSAGTGGSGDEGEPPVERRVGEEIADVVDEIARLRIAVFADWPYLYDGDLDYEARYLARYAATPEAIVVVVRAPGVGGAGAIVGAATGMPLAAHERSIVEAVAATDLAVDETFYCAESVLLPEWRGHGLGHRFFDEREAHARALGYRFACFCAVVRPDDHPARPPAARSLEPFWRGRGYRPLESAGGEAAVARLSWRDRGDAEETEKPLAFWWRSLTG